MRREFELDIVERSKVKVTSFHEVQLQNASWLVFKETFT